jgi:hypothetical protein
LLADVARDIPDSLVAGTALGMIGNGDMLAILPPTAHARFFRTRTSAISASAHPAILR